MTKVEKRDKTELAQLLTVAGIESISDSWDILEFGELLAENRGISVGVIMNYAHMRTNEKEIDDRARL